MAESEEELNSLLMRVKEKNEKAGLKVNIHKTKIMACGPSEEEKLTFYITSFSFCLCNSACLLRSLDHVGHVVSESGDLEY